MQLRRVVTEEAIYTLSVEDMSRIILNSMELPEDQVTSIVFIMGSSLSNRDLEMEITVIHKEEPLPEE